MGSTFGMKPTYLPGHLGLGQVSYSHELALLQGAVPRPQFAMPPSAEEAEEREGEEEEEELEEMEELAEDVEEEEEEEVKGVVGVVPHHNTTGKAARDLSGLMGKRRPRRPENWIKNIKKRKRAIGHETGANCYCKRYKCFDQKTTPQDRRQLIDHFNRLAEYNSQQLFLGTLIEATSTTEDQHGSEEDKPSEPPEPKKKHAYSAKYYVHVNGQDVRVCQKAFCSFFGITPQRVNLLTGKIFKANGSHLPFDARGKHKNRGKRRAPKSDSDSPSPGPSEGGVGGAPPVSATTANNTATSSSSSSSSSSSDIRTLNSSQFQLSQMIPPLVDDLTALPLAAASQQPQVFLPTGMGSSLSQSYYPNLPALRPMPPLMSHIPAPPSSASSSTLSQDVMFSGGLDPNFQYQVIDIKTEPNHLEHS